MISPRLLYDGSYNLINRHCLAGARLTWPYPNHVTTPIDRRLSTEQTITVTDPRHPLCGRTLTLIAMTYHPDLGHCCVIWLRPQVVRLVPVGATHLAFDPNAISPTPLAVDAVARLLRVVQDI